MEPLETLSTTATDIKVLTFYKNKHTGRIVFVLRVITHQKEIEIIDLNYRNEIEIMYSKFFLNNYEEITSLDQHISEKIGNNIKSIRADIKMLQDVLEKMTETFNSLEQANEVYTKNDIAKILFAKSSQNLSEFDRKKKLYIWNEDAKEFQRIEFCKNNSLYFNNLKTKTSQMVLEKVFYAFKDN